MLKTTAVLSIMIPVIVVALPVIDVSLAMVRRYRKKAGIMEPDRDHLHHRLMNRGWTGREVVLLVYVLTLILSVIAIFLAIVKEKLAMSKGARQYHDSPHPNPLLLNREGFTSPVVRSAEGRVRRKPLTLCYFWHAAS